ncbi:hypothetical protein AWC38_SpisGene23131 [Stylophora pistillata]|uniref:Ig-like domain-containing protein n=1 Tax=Stylophora pistillata TaxID=50429 RepID=A0A2B4R7P4_STYPI|nr:hypothetical protein AWC38_SpisGene23131 [Stylophora pistillata]
MLDYTETTDRATTDASPRDTEDIKKEICRIFNANGLRIIVEANKQVINLLDGTFNLSQNTYQPYTKPNTTLQYVHHESNNPTITTKNIPGGINRRLSSLSSDKASFEKAAPAYQKALDDSGYSYILYYEPTHMQRRKNRQRNKILCNGTSWQKKNSNGLFDVTMRRTSNLWCPVKGAPAPYIAWRKNGVPVQNSTSITFQLKITSGNDVNYSCEVQRDGEMFTRNISLRVEECPDPCECDVVHKTISVNCSGKNLISIPWKFPFAIAKLPPLEAFLKWELRIESPSLAYAAPTTSTADCRRFLGMLRIGYILLRSTRMGVILKKFQRDCPINKA